jgi:hypothetical protein
VSVILRPLQLARPPSKGLTAIASIWDSGPIMQRLSYSGAKTIFYVPRRHGRLGTSVVARVRCWNVVSQQRSRRNNFNPRLGDCRGMYSCRSILPWGLYAAQLLWLRSATGFRAAQHAPAKFPSFSFHVLCHLRPISLRAGSVLG